MLPKHTLYNMIQYQIIWSYQDTKNYYPLYPGILTINEPAVQISMVSSYESSGITEDWKHVVQNPQNWLDRNSINSSDLVSLSQTSANTNTFTQPQYPTTIFFDKHYSKFNISLTSSISTNEPFSQYLPQPSLETIDGVINSQSEVSMNAKIFENYNHDNITPSDPPIKEPKNQIQTLTHKSLSNSKISEFKSKPNRKSTHILHIIH